MVHLKIDGKPIEVPTGTTVLEAAQSAGIHIPTLCHFEHLLPYGGCRLCVVEVEGARLLQPSCTLPVYENMSVTTSSPQIKEARDFILTMLFSERNHFCMYCQVSGGDCELQNAALAEGMDHWPLQPNWEPYPVDASHPYFVVDHNRCILCRRCIRACAELVGNNTLGSAMRGAQTMIVADNGIPMGESSCIRCGTCVSVCPTGTLIDRPSAYRGRIVDAEKIDSVCVGCSVGCGIEMVVKDNQLLKINGIWDSPVSEGLLCEVGRFEPLYEKRQRILTPMVRKEGTLKASTWGEALAAVSSQLKPLTGSNGTGIAALASTRLSIEALALFRELFADKLQASMVASVEENFTSSSAFGPDRSDLFATLEDLRRSDCVVVIGADLVASHQVAGFFVKRNLPERTQLILISPEENQMDRHALFSLKPERGTDGELLAAILNVISDLGLNRPGGSEPFTKSIDPALACERCGIPMETIMNAARAIGMAENPVFVFGKGLTGTNRPGRPDPVGTLVELARHTGGKVLSPRGRANSLAAEALGLNVVFQPGGQKAVFVALGDDTISQRQIQVLEEAPFLAVQASYSSPLTAMADVVLPVEVWSEQAGHFLNLEGRLQEARAGLQAPGEVRANAEVLREIADVLGFKLANDWQAGLGSISTTSPVPA